MLGVSVAVRVIARTKTLVAEVVTSMNLALWLIALGTLTLVTVGFIFLRGAKKDIDAGITLSTQESLVIYAINGAIVAIACGVALLLAQ